MNKKTIGIVILAVLIVLVVIGIYLSKNNNNSSSNNGDSSQTGNAVENKVTGDSKMLVAYFSLPETSNPNNMSTEEENSAIVVDGEVLGNVQYMAKLISDNTGSDIYRIEPKIPYTTNHDDLVDQASKEQEEDARPEIKDTINNFSDYDTIFIGYPIWWGDMPQIIYTFLESYDFTDKNVYIFSSHGGSGLAGTPSTIKSKLSKAKVNTDAITISRNNMEDAPDEVKSWLNKLGIID